MGDLPQTNNLSSLFFLFFKKSLQRGSFHVHLESDAMGEFLQVLNHLKTPEAGHKKTRYDDQPNHTRAEQFPCAHV
jgi:hypothetical protein